MEAKMINKKKENQTIICTKQQLNGLFNYMKKHPELITSDQSNQYDKRWIQLTNELNKHGPKRTHMQWKFLWRDLKKRAKINHQDGSFVSQLSQKVLEIIRPDSTENTPQSSLSPINSPEVVANQVNPENKHQKLYYILKTDKNERVIVCPVQNDENVQMNTISTQNGEDNETDISHKHNDKDVTTSSQATLNVTNGSSKKGTGIKSRIRASKAQIEALIEYMGKNLDLVFSHNPENKWMELKEEMTKYGPVKSVTQWKTTWRDLKKKAKSEVESKQKLPELSQKIVDILASDYQYFRMPMPSKDQDSLGSEEDPFYQCETINPADVPANNHIDQNPIITIDNVSNSIKTENEDIILDLELSHDVPHDENSNGQDGVGSSLITTMDYDVSHDDNSNDKDGAGISTMDYENNTDSMEADDDNSNIEFDVNDNSDSEGSHNTNSKCNTPTNPEGLGYSQLLTEAVAQLCYYTSEMRERNSILREQTRMGRKNKRSSTWLSSMSF